MRSLPESSRCFRILNAKNTGLTITLADITEEEFRAMEMIEAARQEQVADEDKDAKSFQDLPLRKPSRRQCDGQICPPGQRRWGTVESQAATLTRSQSGGSEVSSRQHPIR